MFHTIITYESDGVQTDFAVSFDYIKPEYVKAYASDIGFDGLLTTNQTALSYGWVNESMIRLDDVVPAGKLITIQRETYSDAPLVDFQDAAIVTEADLDLAVLQMLHVAQEARDRNSYLLLEAARTLLETAQKYADISEKLEESLNFIEQTIRDLQDVLGSISDLSSGDLGGPVETMYFTSDGVATSYTVPRPKLGRNILLTAFDFETRKKIYFTETAAYDGSIVLETAEPLPVDYKFGVVFLRAVNVGDTVLPFNHTFTYEDPSDTWVITDDLIPDYPRVFCLDDSGNVLVGGQDWSQAANKILTLRFCAPVAGTALISL